MNPELFAKLHSFCQDEVAFEQLQQTLTAKLIPLEREIDRAKLQVDRQKTLFHVIARLREPLLESIFGVAESIYDRAIAAETARKLRDNQNLLKIRSNL